MTPNTDSVDLLQRLSSGIRPGGADAAPRPLSGGGEINFADLLAKAAGGQISSGLTVNVAQNAGVELNADQLARMSVAADKAQAAGAARAVVLIDGQALTLDVATRTISGKADLSPGAALSNIDAVIVAPASGGGKPGPQASPGGPFATLTPAPNASLLDALAPKKP